MRFWVTVVCVCAVACGVPAYAVSDGPPLPPSGDSLPDDGPATVSTVALPPRGAAVVGSRLSVPAPFAGSTRYQWQACRGSSCASIAGATRPTVTLTAVLVGKTIRVEATTDAGLTLVSKKSPPVRAKR